MITSFIVLLVLDLFYYILRHSADLFCSVQLVMDSRPLIYNILRDFQWENMVSAMACSVLVLDIAAHPGFATYVDMRVQ